jgi:hypothetical protein
MDILVAVSLILPARASREEADHQGLFAGRPPSPVLFVVVVLGTQRASGDPHDEPNHEVEPGVAEQSAAETLVRLFR